VLSLRDAKMPTVELATTVKFSIFDIFARRRRQGRTVPCYTARLLSRWPR
jgi:hypothetical protein